MRGARLETKALHECCLRAHPIGLFAGKSVPKDTAVQSQPNWLPMRHSERGGGEREGGRKGEKMTRGELISEANLCEQQRESLGGR